MNVSRINAFVFTLFCMIFVPLQSATKLQLRSALASGIQKNINDMNKESFDTWFATMKQNIEALKPLEAATASQYLFRMRGMINQSTKKNSLELFQKRYLGIPLTAAEVEAEKRLEMIPEFFERAEKEAEQENIERAIKEERDREIAEWMRQEEERARALEQAHEKEEQKAAQENIERTIKEERDREITEWMRQEEERARALEQEYLAKTKQIDEQKKQEEQKARTTKQQEELVKWLQENEIKMNLKKRQALYEFIYKKIGSILARKKDPDLAFYALNRLTPLIAHYQELGGTVGDLHTISQRITNMYGFKLTAIRQKRPDGTTLLRSLFVVSNPDIVEGSPEHFALLNDTASFLAGAMAIDRSRTITDNDVMKSSENIRFDTAPKERLRAAGTTWAQLLFGKNISLNLYNNTASLTNNILSGIAPALPLMAGPEIESEEQRSAREALEKKITQFNYDKNHPLFVKGNITETQLRITLKQANDTKAKNDERIRSLAQAYGIAEENPPFLTQENIDSINNLLRTTPFEFPADRIPDLTFTPPSNQQLFEYQQNETKEKISYNKVQQFDFNAATQLPADARTAGMLYQIYEKKEIKPVGAATYINSLLEQLGIDAPRLAEPSAQTEPEKKEPSSTDVTQPETPSTVAIINPDFNRGRLAGEKTVLTWFNQKSDIDTALAKYSIANAPQKDKHYWLGYAYGRAVNKSKPSTNQRLTIPQAEKINELTEKEKIVVYELDIQKFKDAEYEQGKNAGRAERKVDARGRISKMLDDITKKEYPYETVGRVYSYILTDDFNNVAPGKEATPEQLNALKEAFKKLNYDVKTPSDAEYKQLLFNHGKEQGLKKFVGMGVGINPRKEIANTLNILDQKTSPNPAYDIGLAYGYASNPQAKGSYAATDRQKRTINELIGTYTQKLPAQTDPVQMLIIDIKEEEDIPFGGVKGGHSMLQKLGNTFVKLNTEYRDQLSKLSDAQKRQVQAGIQNFLKEKGWSLVSHNNAYAFINATTITTNEQRQKSIKLVHQMLTAEEDAKLLTPTAIAARAKQTPDDNTIGRVWFFGFDYSKQPNPDSDILRKIDEKIAAWSKQNNLPGVPPQIFFEGQIIEYSPTEEVIRPRPQPQQPAEQPSRYSEEEWERWQQQQEEFERIQSETEDVLRAAQEEAARRREEEAERAREEAQRKEEEKEIREEGTFFGLGTE